VIEASTREAYTYQIGKHILPWFGPMRMNEVMPSHVREWVTALQAKGVTPASIQKLRFILSAIFTAALNDVTFLHPCKGVKTPTVVVVLGTDQGEPGLRAISTGQFRQTQKHVVARVAFRSAAVPGIEPLAGRGEPVRMAPHEHHASVIPRTSGSHGHSHLLADLHPRPLFDALSLPAGPGACSPATEVLAVRCRQGRKEALWSWVARTGGRPGYSLSTRLASNLPAHGLESRGVLGPVQGAPVRLFCAQGAQAAGMVANALSACGLPGKAARMGPTGRDGSRDAATRTRSESGSGTSGAGQDTEWAICCSGGGIRSASYCLGALQSLQGPEANGLFGKVRHILSVSGGSYIAASRALVARDLKSTDPPAYGLGTPEEDNLRDNTHYLAPNGGVVLVGVLSLLVGVTVTFILVFAPVFAVAHAWGWLLRWQKVLCPGSVQRCGTPGPFVASVTSPTWWSLVPAVAGGLTLVLFVWWWLTLKPRQKQSRPAEPRRGEPRDQPVTLAKVTGWAALVTAALAVAMLVVPLLLSWVAKLPAGAFKSLAYDLGFGVGQKWTPAALTGVFAALIAVAQSCRAKLAQLQLPGAQGKPASQTKAQTQQQDAAAPGLLTSIGGRIRTYVLPWLASAVIVLIAVVAGLRWVKDGAAIGYSAEQLWPVLIALGVMLATRLLADVNRISMHDFYRWRLASAYAVRRNPSGNSWSEKVTRDPGALLSSLAKHSPKLVICTTANINQARQVPVGRGGMLLTFDPEQVTLRGEDPEHPVIAPTKDYESLVGKRRLTLFDVSAISGAAVSPLMGSMTRQAYRILLTMTNVRLGVWLPHPAIVAAASQELKDQESGHRGGAPGPARRPPGGEAHELSREGRRRPKKDRWWTALGMLLWYAFPWHPGWSENTQQPGGGEARLWAYVLRMRRKGTWLSRKIGGLFYHALQPTLGMLWAEAVGHTSYRATWICVSDGGHYDNLGLVEALWRGAANVLVLDASGDKANTWYTLGGAIALAKVDAGVNIELDPTQMCPKPLHPGEVAQPWAHGPFTRVEGWQGRDAAHNGRPDKGTIWVCKLGWWADAPWDVRSYAGQHSEFPGQSTMQQLYDGAEFDAYRVLGLSAVGAALKGGLRPAHPRARGRCRALQRWMKPQTETTQRPRQVAARLVEDHSNQVQIT
jgi:hypothetical protein